MPEPIQPITPPGWRGRLIERLQARRLYRRWVLVAALAGMFATSFPATILSVSIATIADEFDTSVATMQWVVTAPLLLSAVTVPILGKMGDLYGHRRVFLVGFTLAVISSALTGMSTSPLMLIGLRTFSQVIGGATGPTSMALVLMVHDRDDRVKALGWWQLVAAGAPSIGLALGGPLVEAVGWQWVFVIQAGLALFALILAWMMLPHTAGRPGVRFDLPGTLALMVGVGGAVFTLGQGRVLGWTDPWVIAAIIATPLGLLAFSLVERRVTHPLLDLDLLRNPNFSLALLTVFVVATVYMGGFVLVPLALQDTFGRSVAVSAWLMLFRTGTFSLSSPLGGEAASRLGAPIAVRFGITLLGASMTMLVVGLHTDQIVLFVGGLALMGLGNGFIRPALTATIANSVSDDDLGVSSAFNRMMQQIGNALGITLFFALYDGSGTAEAFGVPFSVGIGLAGLAMAAAWRVRGRPGDLLTPRVGP
ncbi:MAG: MFS transporter [Actinomycetia bacterium]|nr:MFS transporter [Actinomycetes bacterium]